ncbi:hypothetical protein CI102_4316 [Trichoderma harzianum]|nr:hypothetical protein CI102_4316 [Trichoderma harzianum]
MLNWNTFMYFPMTAIVMLFASHLLHVSSAISVSQPTAIWIMARSRTGNRLIVTIQSRLKENPQHRN